MTTRIPMLDLGPEWAEVGPAVESAVGRVLSHRRFVLGAEVEAFEREAAAALGVEHAVAVSSGTDALLAALMALGVGPGDEVVTTALSFFATAEAILRVGATPRFADVSSTTLNVDPEAVAPLIGPRTKAVVVVHLFGRAADVRALAALCGARGVALVEDAAQAFGVRVGGEPLGGFGALGCFSFFPSKPLGGLGDAGMVVTRRADLAARLRSLRSHGAEARNEHAVVGGNFRMDALQAAALGAKLPGFEARLAARRALVGAYDEALRGAPLVAGLARGFEDEAPAAVYALRVRDGKRDALRRALDEAGIDTAVYYPRCLGDQPAVRAAVADVDPTPVAARACEEALALPLYYGMPMEVAGRVGRVVGDFARSTR